LDGEGIVSSILIVNICLEVYGSNGSLQYMRTTGKAAYVYAMRKFSVFPVHHRRGGLH